LELSPNTKNKKGGVMRIGINWEEKSTRYGALTLYGAVAALIFYWNGKDPMPVMVVTSSLAGSLGLLVKD